MEFGGKSMNNFKDSEYYQITTVMDCLRTPKSMCRNLINP